MDREDTPDSGIEHDQYAEDRRKMAALLDETHLDHDRCWREVETYAASIVGRWCFRAGRTRGPEEVEDLQSACLEAIARSIGSFRHDSALTTWIHSVILLNLKKHLRDTSRQKRDPRRLTRLDDGQLDQAPAPDKDTPASLAAGNALLAAIEAVLRTHTNPHIYTVFMLIAVAGWRGTEVAAALGISQPHVANLLRQARELLRRSPELRPWIDEYLGESAEEME